jgi:hypothetical protein
VSHRCRRVGVRRAHEQTDPQHEGTLDQLQLAGGPRFEPSTTRTGCGGERDASPGSLSDVALAGLSELVTVEHANGDPISGASALLAVGHLLDLAGAAVQPDLAKLAEVGDYVEGAGFVLEYIGDAA